jgi:ferritin-like metal-binding protein YciE
MKTLQDLFQMELADIYDAEHRIVRSYAKLAKAAQSSEVQESFLTHLRETEEDVKKTERVFRAFGMKPHVKKCQGIVGVLGEGDEIAEEFRNTPALDAALISAAQKVEHYEIVSCGCLQEWAELLGNEEAAGLLQEILDTHKNANETMTELARSICNEEALGEAVMAEAPAEESSAGSRSKRR